MIKKDHLEFMFESVSTIIGFNPICPSNRVARISLAYKYTECIDYCCLYAASICVIYMPHLRFNKQAILIAVKQPDRFSCVHIEEGVRGTVRNWGLGYTRILSYAIIDVIILTRGCSRIRKKKYI